MSIPINNAVESDTVQWREGHCLRWKEHLNHSDCKICFGLFEGKGFVCDGYSPSPYQNLRRKLTSLGCQLAVHHQCLDAVTLPCLSPANFCPHRIRAAFLRCFASLLFNYRKALEPVPNDMRAVGGVLFNFKAHQFLRSASREAAPYLQLVCETQAFNEFIMERCMKSPDDPEVALFDEIIIAKRNRGRYGLFGKQCTSSPPSS